MEEVDKTIIAICKWIQADLDSAENVDGLINVPEMTKALAELISARVRAEYGY